MMNAEYEFKKLINKRGYYAKINIDLTPSDNPEIFLDFDKASKWYPAVNFGIRYFHERYLKTGERGFDIKVNQLNTQIVDSSLMVVFYVTVKAIHQALNIEDSDIYIDEAGNLVMPK
jgi:hypothetical protein